MSAEYKVQWRGAGRKQWRVLSYENYAGSDARYFATREEAERYCAQKNDPDYHEPGEWRDL